MGGLSFVLAAALSLTLAVGGGAAKPQLPRVESKLPAWVAPHAPVTVRGWTLPHARVSLLSGSRTIGTATGGRLGRFAVSGAAPAPGRYRITVVSAGRRLPAGALRVRPIVLAAAGDVTFGDGVGSAIAAYGPEYPWREVGSTFRSADIATVNLEGVVSTRGTPVPGKPFTFRGPPAALAAAATLAGLDVVSIANNHSVDFGRQAFADTVRTARALEIATAGGGRNLAAARRPAVLRRGGLRIAFLAYCDIEPPGFYATADTPGTAPAVRAQIAADVRLAAGRADLVVVWFHWGIEREFTPNSRQAQLAEAALSAGADLVLGAHPHVLQPLERRGGHHLIAWSLGNFVFVPHSAGTERSGILRVELDADGVRAYRLIPALAGPQPRLS